MPPITTRTISASLSAIPPSQGTITPRFTLNVESVMKHIGGVVNKVVSDTTKSAFGVAKAKAPVRRIFKGRQTVWTEHGGRMVPYLRGYKPDLFTPAWEAMMLHGGLRTTWDRARNKRYIASNSSWSQTRDARLINVNKLEFYKGEIIGGTVELSPGYAKYLTSRGRYEVKHALQRGSLLEMGEAAKVGQAESRRASSALPSQITVGGHLRNSVEMVDADYGDTIRKKVIAGGPSAPYAKYVEFGTRRSRAQPFLRPALKHAEAGYSQRMRSALQKLGKANPIN